MERDSSCFSAVLQYEGIKVTCFYFFPDILYQIRRVSLEDKSYMYCLWIAKDPEDCTATSRLGTLTLANSNAETLDDSLGEVNKYEYKNNLKCHRCLYVRPGIT